MKANKGLKFNTECKIIFGRNISGLIAAKELGMLYPDSRSNIFVVSSVYNTSMKVFAHKISMTQVQCSFKVFGDTPTRAYPIPPLPGTSSIMYNTTDTRSSVVIKKKCSEKYSRRGPSLTTCQILKKKIFFFSFQEIS